MWGELTDRNDQNRDHRGKGYLGGGKGAPHVGVVTYILLVLQRTWPLSPLHWCQIPRRRRKAPRRGWGPGGTEWLTSGASMSC